MHFVPNTLKDNIYVTHEGAPMIELCLQNLKLPSGIYLTTGVAQYCDKGS